MRIWEQCILGRGTSWCKGLKVGVCLVGIAQSPQSLVREKDGCRVGDETGEQPAYNPICMGCDRTDLYPRWERKLLQDVLAVEYHYLTGVYLLNECRLSEGNQRIRESRWGSLHRKKSGCILHVD